MYAKMAGFPGNIGGGNVKKIEYGHTLDKEWLELILEARALGLNIEDIRVFLLEARKKSG